MAIEIREVGSVEAGASCPFCGVVVLPPYDPNAVEPWSPAPKCAHVFLLADDHCIAYLSKPARKQMAASGVLVMDEPDGQILLETDEDEEPTRTMDPVLSTVRAEGAVILAVYAPAPSLEGTYVGVAKSWQ